MSEKGEAGEGAGRMLRRVAGRVLGRRVAALEARVAELEAEVRECRRHHLRVAELTDVVTELLVPLARRDEAAIEQVLRDYTDQLG